MGLPGAGTLSAEVPGLSIPNECRLLNDAAYAEARWAELQNQGDLAWDLDAITNRSEAIAFLKRFENRLCIYSAYVEKLYSNYSFVIPESDHGGITILPSEQAWHDTFHDIPLAAVEPTGIHILPGETMGYRGLYLKIPGEHRLVASKELPFQEGLKLLIQRYQAHDDVFLPILVRATCASTKRACPRYTCTGSTRPPQRTLLPSLNAIKGAIADHLIGLFRQQ